MSADCCMCLGAGSGAPWRPWDDGGHHGRPVREFYLAFQQSFLLHIWALSGAAAGSVDATAGRTPACMVSLRGGWGDASRGRDGREKLDRLIVQLGSRR